MSRHEHAGALHDLRKAVETLEVAREIGCVRVRVGQLDVAEHVSCDEHGGVNDLYCEVSTRVRVVLVEDDVSSAPWQAGRWDWCHMPGEVDEVVGDVAEQGLDECGTVRPPLIGGPRARPARHPTQIGVPQHVVVVQVRCESRGTSCGGGREKGRDTCELVGVPARIDDERLISGDDDGGCGGVPTRCHHVDAGCDLHGVTTHVGSLGGEQLHAIRRERSVARHQDKSVEFCLRDKHAIEGIRVMQGK